MSHANVKIGRGAFNSNAHGQQLLIDINDKMRIDLDQIKTNTSNIQVNVDNVNLNTDNLETLITDLKNHHTQDGLGGGNKLGVIMDSIASSSNHIKENTEFVNSRLNNIQNKLSQNTDGTGNTLGEISNNIESACNTIKDNTEFVNSRLNNIQNKLAQNTDGSGNTLGQINSNILSKITDQETHLGNIDTGIDVLEACVGSNKVNVNISSGGFDGVVSGTITANLSATDNAVLDAIAVDGDNIQTKLDTLETSLTSMEGKQDNMITALQILDNCISGNEAQVDVITMPTTTVQGTITANLSATDNAVLDAIAVDGDNIQTKLDTIDGSINTLEACVGSNKVNVNISSGGFDGVVSGTITANLSATDNAVLDAIAVDGDNIQTKLDTIDGVLDNILVQNTASEVHLSNIDNLSRVNIATGASQLNNNDHVGPEDCSKFSEICIVYLTTTSTSGKKIFITGSTTSGGTYNPFAQMNLIQLQADSGGSVNAYMYGSGNSTQNNAEFIPCVYPFIKIQNISGTDLTDTDDIRIIGR